MLTHLHIRLAEISLILVLAAALLFVWRTERRDRAELAIQLATAKQALAAADSRQHDRDAQLVQTLSTLAAQKRAVNTPEQILRALPQQIPLPTPITLDPSANSSQATVSTRNAEDSAHSTNVTNRRAAPLGAILVRNDGDTTPHAGNITGSQALIPTEDLKPLYDFAVDCQACQAKLIASQADLTDEKTKTATVTKERDAAIRNAKGGSALRRIGRAAKWFAIGAAAGALAARTTH